MISAPSVEQQANPFAGLNPADAAALAAFDKAFEPFAPDPALLEGAPARMLGDALSEFVTALTHLDVDRVARRSGWWSRFTGADIEARLELEVAAHRLSADMHNLAQAAGAARRASAAMKADAVRLAAIAPLHQRLAEQAVEFARGGHSRDPNVARLQRRIANLETMIVSNQLVGAQMGVALEHLATLLDRYADIEKRLFPVWRHHALALAQSAGRSVEPKSLEQLRAVRARLMPRPQAQE
jgi:hypothetical protein